MESQAMLNAKLDRLIQSNLKKVAPAVSLAIYHQGALVMKGAWGWLDPETKQRAVTTETLFDLASLTKLYTTTAFLALAGAQNIPLDTPLIDILPEFGANNPRPIDGGQDPFTKQTLPTPEHLRGKTVDVSAVTLWHLLTHMSGLAPWRDVYTVAPPPLVIDDPVSRGERWRRGLERLLTYPFVDEVGVGVRYSDIGLMLLGEVVARLHGGNLETAIQNEVISPLNLSAHGPICFNPRRDYGYLPQQIAPTELDNTWRGRRCWGEVHDENACGLGGVAGHAGLFSTAEVMAAFGAAWLGSEALPISPQLWAAAIREQTRTGDERRGLGWMLRGENSSAGRLMGERAFGHTGFTGTSLWIDPDKALVVALLTNRVYDGRDNFVGVHTLRRNVHDAIMEALA